MNNQTAQPDIVAQKSELRNKYKLQRLSMRNEEKIFIDKMIIERLLSIYGFSYSKWLFSYVSMGDEVDTREIINLSLKSGKRVAVPRSYPERNVMVFYEIKSLEELKSGKYGILEPDEDPDRRIQNPSSAVCLVPGLSFDRTGNRLGYGGGYYDRFLKDFNGLSVGLCRSGQISNINLPQDAYDVPVKRIVTENEIICASPNA
jgi:5-formyltetrahydrofolate cyclo-ligase